MKRLRECANRGIASVKNLGCGGRLICTTTWDSWVFRPGLVTWPCVATLLIVARAVWLRLTFGISVPILSSITSPIGNGLILRLLYMFLVGFLVLLRSLEQLLAAQVI